MKVLKTRFSYILFLSMVLSGCDYLLEEPTSFITDENYYKTESDALAATNAIYDLLSIGPDFVFSYGYGGPFFYTHWVIMDLASDNALSHRDIVDDQKLSTLEITPDNAIITELWFKLYRVINGCNTVIDKLPGCQMSEVDRVHMMAEAYFWRGMMYFELIKCFGDVPYYDHATTTVAASYVERTPEMEILEYIIDDLNQARDGLTNTLRQGQGRPNPLIVKAFLSRVYLFKGFKTGEVSDYQLCLDNTQEVISTETFSLWEDYADLWKLRNMHGKESIISINFNATNSNDLRGSQFLVRLLPEEISAQKPSGLSDVVPTNANGWELPTEALYYAFENGDRRRSVSFVSEFDYSDGSSIQFDPYFSKYWDREIEPGGRNSDQDFPYMRYADLLLMKSEAINEINGGPNSEAYEAINAVRKRARFDGTVYQDVLPDLAGLSYDQFRDALLDERQREFAMEGHRWYDLKRFGKLVEKIKEAKPSTNPGEHLYYLPIPSRERGINPNLTQNDGY